MWKSQYTVCITHFTFVQDVIYTACVQMRCYIHSINIILNILPPTWFNVITILMLPSYRSKWFKHHYNDVIMGAIASQITSLTIVYSTVYSGADQRIHKSYASLAFVWGIHRGLVNSPHQWPVTRKCFYWIMSSCSRCYFQLHNFQP